MGCATADPFKVTAPGVTFRLVADQVFSLGALKETLPPDIHFRLLSVIKLFNCFFNQSQAAHLQLINTWWEDSQDCAPTQFPFLTSMEMQLHTWQESVR